MYFVIRTAPFTFPTELEVRTEGHQIAGLVTVAADGTYSAAVIGIHSTKLDRVLRRDGWLQTEAQLVASRSADRDDVLTQS